LASLSVFAKARVTLHGVPMLVVKTKSSSCHLLPAHCFCFTSIIVFLAGSSSSSEDKKVESAPFQFAGDIPSHSDFFVFSHSKCRFSSEALSVNRFTSSLLPALQPHFLVDAALTQIRTQGVSGDFGFDSGFPESLRTPDSKAQRAVWMKGPLGTCHFAAYTTPHTHEALAAVS
jgi:hypothetical protein